MHVSFGIFVVVICMFGENVHVTSSGIRVPLKRVESLREKLIHAGKLTAFHAGHSLALASAEPNSDPKLPLYDYSDATYLGYVAFGSPPQGFYVIFDTGSNLAWVPDSSCSNISCGANKYKFNVSKSTSFKQNGGKFDIDGLYADVKGDLGYDTMTIGDTTTTSQIFGRATFESGGLRDTVGDGIFGLGHSSLQSDGDLQPLQNMYKQKQISQPVFSMFVENTKSNIGGELLLGGIDTAKFIGDIAYIPVIEGNDQWIINVDSVSYYTTDFRGPYKAIVNTASTYITLPIAMNDYIGFSMYGTYDTSTGMYQVDCSISPSLYPPISFMMNGFNMTLSPSTYVINITNKCYVAFQGSGAHDTDIILGLEWIKEYYSIFDFGSKRIGFAKAVHQ